mmetsp:Transcript_31937/g.81024  ORF Transcript_31937/g.81024 Transcript_31937/m.81024 type:complete len:283 (+) Transcript_31937:686-1534(+)
MARALLPQGNLLLVQRTEDLELVAKLPLLHAAVQQGLAEASDLVVALAGARLCACILLRRLIIDVLLQLLDPVLSTCPLAVDIFKFVHTDSCGPMSHRPSEAIHGAAEETVTTEGALATHSDAALRRGDGLQELRHVREVLGVRRVWRRGRRRQLPLRICGRCYPLQPLDLPGLRCHVLCQQPGVVSEHGRPLKSLDLCWLRKCTTNTTRFQMRPVNIGSVLARSIVLRGGMPQLRAHRISLLTDVGHAQILAAPPHTRKGLEVVDGLRDHMYGRLHFRPWR